MSVGLDTIDEMIRATAEGQTELINAAVAHNPLTPWNKRATEVGAEMGVGIRLMILREVRTRVRDAEMKELEANRE